MLIIKPHLTKFHGFLQTVGGSSLYGTERAKEPRAALGDPRSPQVPGCGSWAGPWGLAPSKAHSSYLTSQTNIHCRDQINTQKPHPMLRDVCL